MKRAWILFLISGIGLVLFAWFEPGGRLVGWLSGEPFYAGYPAHYWGMQLRGDDPRSLSESLTQLRLGKDKATEVLCYLVHAEEDRTWSQSETRWRAVELLAKSKSTQQTVLETLCDASHDADPLVRSMAIRSLGQLAPTAVDAIPSLIEALSTPERKTAVEALQLFGPAAKGAVETLSLLLDATNEEGLRAATASCLARIGKAARSTLPRLRENTRDRSPLVREKAALALGRISDGDVESVNALEHLLDDSDANVRRYAVRSLGWMGPKAKSALPDVIRLTKDKDSSVSKAAQQALVQIQPPKPPEKALR